MRAVERPATLAPPRDMASTAGVSGPGVLLSWNRVCTGGVTASFRAYACALIEAVHGFHEMQRP